MHRLIIAVVGLAMLSGSVSTAQAGRVGGPATGGDGLVPNGTTVFVAMFTNHGMPEITVTHRSAGYLEITIFTPDGKRLVSYAGGQGARIQLGSWVPYRNYIIRVRNPTGQPIVFYITIR